MRIAPLIAAGLLVVCSIPARAELTELVRPFVGTSNFGTTNPGAVLPHAMMSVSPFNVTGSELNTFDKDSRWWSTPYSSDNCFLTGFSHVNLSGVGCPELGAVLTMPTAGALEVRKEKYGSAYSDSVASPGYYAVTLDKYDIRAEVSATLRSCIERYTFPEGEANILVNLGDALSNESGAVIRRISETEIEGMRVCGTFCYNPAAVFNLYFFIRLDKAPKTSGFWKKQPEMTAEAQWDSTAGKYKIYSDSPFEIAGNDIGAWFTFDAREAEEVTLRMGVSFVSCDNARENLEREQQGRSFNQIREAAELEWEHALGRIRVSGGTRQRQEVFYTALYHSLLHPNVLNDFNGEYPLMQGGPLAKANGIEVVRQGVGRVPEGHLRYTVFSLWDTCRNLHQLLTLVYPEVQTDMLRSMVDMYKEWGWMPKWELYGRETFTMEGDPAIPVITDSYLKGLRDFDIDAAYEAFRKSADSPGKDNPLRPDNDPYLEEGYIPLGAYAADFSGDNSVSHALEYYMADNALSLLASKLASERSDKGYGADAKRYRERSLRWRNYYSRESGTLRPRLQDGSFLTPFDPSDGADFSNAPGFHEGSAWNYTFYIPHDIEGLTKAMGGKKAFVRRLQKVFDEGLYDPANEPDIAYPYLFARFQGEEWRTDTIVHRILERYYTTAADGLPGNDDCGTMSAWAVFSMMGFYPDCPGEPFYTLTEPAFDSIRIGEGIEIRKGVKIPKRRVSHEEFLRLYEKKW